MGGIDGNGAVETGNRFLGAPQFREGAAAIVECIAVIGIDGDGAIETY